MLKWLKNNLPNPEKLLTSPQHKKQFLSKYADEFLFTLRLTGVEMTELLKDPKQLWVPHAGGDNIKHMESKDKDRRLWTALDTHRHQGKGYDKDRDHEIIEGKVFSDVVIWIPEIYWRNVNRQGGAALSVMVDQLQKQHRKDFQHQLNEDREPHYCVMPQRHLKDDEVICQFGLSVFIPGEEDQQLGEMSLMYAGSGHPLPEWLFREHNRLVKRPAGWYAGQKHIQLSPLLEQSCLHPSVWFNHRKGFLQINLEGEVKDTELHQLFADGDYVREGEVDNRLSSFVFTFHNTENPKDDQLILKIILQEHISAAVDDVVGEDASASERARGLTMIFQPTPTPQDIYQLLIKGIALPRFDTGLSGNFEKWSLQFNAQGDLINSDDYEGDQLEFMAYSKQAGLWYQRPKDKKPQKIKLPQSLDCAEHVFSLKKAPLPSFYHAFLELPLQKAYTLGEKVTLLGRNDQKNNNYITLNLLDKPNTLIFLNGKSPDLSINYLGLSNEHIELQRRKDILYVKQKSESAPFYILDKNCQLKQTLAKATVNKNGTINAEEGKLVVGDHLLVGYYLLSFYHRGQ
ncbi:MAG: hypothetical protein KAG20_09725 [Cocleimonas sp.]|nr:hypothetical protein [Cocleimonas sp.]